MSSELSELERQQVELQSVLTSDRATLLQITEAKKQLAEIELQIAQVRVEELEQKISALGLENLRSQIASAKQEVDEAWQEYDLAEERKHRALAAMEKLNGQLVYQQSQARFFRDQITAIKSGVRV